jgi:hypothetical protein
VDDVVETVNADVPAPPPDRVMLGKLSDILGPEGEIEAAKLMVPLNPFRLISVIVEAPEDPAGMVRLLRLAVMAKSGCGEGLTVTATLTARENDPLVPVTVTL